MVSLVVSNNTLNISDTNIEKLFDRFYKGDDARTKTPEDTKSYGLGLSIAKSIVEKHSGKIKAEKTNDGIKLKVLLPLAK